MIIKNLKEYKTIESFDKLDLLAFSIIFKKHHVILMNECKDNLRLKQVVERKLKKLSQHSNINPIYLQYEV